MEAEIIDIPIEPKKPRAGAGFVRGAFGFAIGYAAEELGKKVWDVGLKMIRTYRA